LRNSHDVALLSSHFTSPFSTERATAALIAWLRELEDLIHSKRPGHGTTHNLPQLQPKLVGREVQKTSLMQALRTHPAIAIIGPAGIGKTSLAVRIAYEFANQSEPREFDYVVWFAAREHREHQQWLSDLLDTIGETLGSRRVSQKRADQIRDKITQVEVLLNITS
jgi:Cdc6-like AAA superfamily ATPase